MKRPRAPATRVTGIAIALALASLALFLWIAWRHPVVYWWDVYLRLAEPGKLVVWRWLPLLQLWILAAPDLGDGAMPLRAGLAAISAMAVSAAWLLGRRLFGDAGGLVGAAWLLSAPIFVVLATVPYQEPLFLLVLFLALWSLERGDRAFAAVFATLACATRYEGWLLIPIAAAEELARGLRRGRGAAAAAGRALAAGLAFGGAFALAWLALGSFELLEGEKQRSLTLAWLGGSAKDLAGLLVRHFGLVPLGLALLGIAAALRQKRAIHARILAFLGLDLALVVVLDPFSPGNERRDFVAGSLLMLYAGGGAAWLAGRVALARSAQALLLAVAAAVVGVRHLQEGLREVAKHASEPSLVRARAAGLWLRREAPPGARVISLTERYIQRHALAAWSGLALERIEEGSSEAGGGGPLGQRSRELLQGGGELVVVALGEEALRSAETLSELRSEGVQVEVRSIEGPGAMGAWILRR